ncbi:MAG: adenylate/guanylate cyclase domain-containing protein [Bacteroidota bacterium]
MKLLYIYLIEHCIPACRLLIRQSREAKYLGNLFTDFSAYKGGSALKQIRTWGLILLLLIALPALGFTNIPRVPDTIAQNSEQLVPDASEQFKELYRSTAPFLNSFVDFSSASHQTTQLLILLIITLALYNLVRFFVIQDLSMFLLSITLVGMALFWCSAFGMWDSMFGFETVSYGSTVIFYTGTIAIVGVLGFSITFLSTKYLSPGSYTALSVMVLMFIVLALMGMLGWWTAAIWGQLLLVGVSMLFLLIVAIISVTKGFPPAYYYIGSHLSLFGIVALWLLSDFSMEDIDLSQHTMIIGMATLQPIFLTLGSEFRITYLKRQKEEAKALAIASHRLARYFPKQLVNKVLSDDKMISLNSKRQMVTVLFSDLSGFTSLTDQLEPERITELLNQFMTHMVAIINRHDGTLDKFIGDGIMALFGAPNEMDAEDQARQAIRAALLMHQKFDDLAKRWKDEGIDHDIKLRIGIHQDFVTVGNVGSNQYMSYTAIGRGVNLASRLERACTPGHINVSYEVYSHTHSEFPYGELQKKLFKGFKRPHRTSELNPWEYFQDDIKSRNRKSKISQRFY